MIAFHGDQFRYNPELKSSSIYEEDDILFSLNKEGVNSEKGKEILSKWLEKKEKEADESESKYSRLKYFIGVAELYYRLGLHVEAMLYVEDAWDMIDCYMRNDGSKELGLLVTYLIYLDEELENKI